MARDSKGWRIDRRRSVTRYSCQQAAGIAALPFPSSVSSTIASWGAPPPSGRRSLDPLARSPMDARLPGNILRVNAASMFSQRDEASRWHSPCHVLSLRLPQRMFRFPCIYRAPPFSRVQRFIPRSWNTAAVTPSPALIGDNCSIFLEV